MQTQFAKEIDTLGIMQENLHVFHSIMLLKESEREEVGDRPPTHRVSRACSSCPLLFPLLGLSQAKAVSP